MTNALRVFFVGGAISYRALFNWLHWTMYVPTMLGSPLFQILFFAYLGRTSNTADDSYFVVGNAVQACSMAALYGATQTVGNERQFGTLAPLLATPANRAALFLGRALPLIVNGLVVSTFGLVVGRLFLDFHPAPSSLPALALVLVVTVCSTVAFGMALGALGMRARDVFFSSNLMYFLMLLVCGVNVDPEQLPGWLQAIGEALPLTHGIEAARGIVAGRSLASVGHLVWTEALVGAIWALVAVALFRIFEAESHRRASLETA
jgi:ABC-2 type transport system permease protein